MTETTEPSRATTMKAVEQVEYGSADDLQLKDIARPAPANDELLVHVRAASVGAWDWHDMPGDPFVMRLTGRSLRRPRNTVLGLDMAGEVVEVGDDVSRFRPGDLVYGAGSAFAEYTLAKEDDIARAPSRLSFAEAAAVPIAGSTALEALEALAELIENGDLAPVIDATYPLGDAAEAVRRFEHAHGPGRSCSPTEQAASCDRPPNQRHDHLIGSRQHPIEPKERP